MPPQGNENIASRILRNIRVTSPKPPSTTLTCNQVPDEATGRIGIDILWSYDHEPLVQEAIVENVLGFDLQIRSISSGNFEVVRGNVTRGDPTRKQEVI